MRKKKLKALADLQPDLANANKGTERGIGALEHSLGRYGAGRSVLVSKDGVVIAGNKTVQAAAERELPIRVIETDGTELVVVQRTDLASGTKEAVSLGVADNRCSEVGLDWDVAELKALEADDLVDLGEFWLDGELPSGIMDEEGGGEGGGEDAPCCPTCGKKMKGGDK
ncbi:MAG: hypothetical protein GY832_21895 [Chloroflexi bacterium]|nr:hypothetical protein [Chloroflexota bacterium]